MTKAIDRRWLEEAALAYIQRYQSSAESLRRVLMRRIRRRVRLAGTEPDDLAETLAAEGEAVEALIQRYIATGLIDDRAFAVAKTASLHRRGYSRRAIGVRLRQKGIDRDLIAEQLAAADTEHRPGGDVAAAVRMAKRRHFGPFRPPDTRSAFAPKDLASLIRAGFDAATARRILACADEAAVAALLAEMEEG